MKAVICTKYGPPEVLEFREIQKPIPRDHEVLIKNYATTVHIGDTKIRAFKPGMGAVKDFFFQPIMRFMIGFWGPRKNILGMELAGGVEQIGKSVTRYKTEDQVFASTDLNFGAYAEYVCLSEDSIMGKKPENMSYGEAATVPNGALTALYVLRKANIQMEQKVLIYGASGSVGTFAVQIAKYLGAVVTGVCSTSNMEMVKMLGADEVLDYTREDFTMHVGYYDVIFDAVGKAEYSSTKSALKGTGIYLNVLTSSSGLKLKIEDLNFLVSLIESGHLRTVIDREYSFDQMIEAHRYVDSGHKKGNVVIRVSEPDL